GSGLACGFQHTEDKSSASLESARLFSSSPSTCLNEDTGRRYRIPGWRSHSDPPCSAHSVLPQCCAGSSWDRGTRN
ncbi:unnamed protein product, partial [Gulo gulo]